ncbi:MAG: hypothetical protein RLZZ338_69 [Cyanobacteriota bacterium]|jgi:hypothetical protein
MVKQKFHLADELYGELGTGGASPKGKLGVGWRSLCVVGASRSLGI